MSATSCNKVAKGDLSGTVWEYSGNLEGLAVTATFTFSKTDFTMTSSISSGASQSVNGVYTYNYPNLSMTAFEETIVAVMAADYKSFSIEGEGITFNRKK